MEIIKTLQVTQGLFPNLDFRLLIMNPYDGTGFSVEEQVSDSILTQVVTICNPLQGIMGDNLG